MERPAGPFLGVKDGERQRRKLAQVLNGFELFGLPIRRRYGKDIMCHTCVSVHLAISCLAPLYDLERTHRT